MGVSQKGLVAAAFGIAAGSFSADKEKALQTEIEVKASGAAGGRHAVGRSVGRHKTSVGRASIIRKSVSEWNGYYVFLYLLTSNRRCTRLREHTRESVSEWNGLPAVIRYEYYGSQGEGRGSSAVW